MLDIRLIRGHDFLRSDLEGNLDFKKTRRLLRELILANTSSRYNLLIDMRDSIDMRGSKETLSYAEVYRLVEELDKHAPLFRGRVALLDRWDEGFEKTQSFEAFASLRGFAVRTFLEFEQAITWVCHGAAPSSP